jgi:tetratricopeptide (TPR) repeat protein
MIGVMASAGPAWGQNADEDWVRFAQIGVQAYGVNQVEKALENLEAAMKIADENFAPDDPRTLGSLLNLAPVYSSLKRYEEAVVLAERAVALQDQLGGPENPDLTLSLPMLAAIYRDLGQFDDAAATLERAVNLMDLIMGEVNPRALTVREEYAIALFRADRLAEAVDMFEFILPLWDESLGPNHIRSAMSYAAYAGLLRDVGRVEDAAAADAKVLEIRREWGNR